MLTLEITEISKHQNLGLKKSDAYKYKMSVHKKYPEQRHSASQFLFFSNFKKINSEVTKPRVAYIKCHVIKKMTRFCEGKGHISNRKAYRKIGQFL